MDYGLNENPLIKLRIPTFMVRRYWSCVPQYYPIITCLSNKMRFFLRRDRKEIGPNVVSALS